MTEEHTFVTANILHREERWEEALKAYLNTLPVAPEPVREMVLWNIHWLLRKSPPGALSASSLLRTYRKLKGGSQQIKPTRRLVSKKINEALPRHLTSRRDILLEVHKIRNKLGSAAASAYAELNVDDAESHVLHVVRASEAADVGDVDSWIFHMNRYLSYYGLSSATLSRGAGPIVERLSGKPRRISGGPLVSILMPAYNSERSLRSSVQSILSQSWENIELIVVDDCSTDSTWTVLREFAEQDARVFVVRNSHNVGPYVSRNIALLSARGDWVTCHDADDWAHPQRIERQVRFCLEEQLSAGIGGMIRVDKEGRVSQFSRLKSRFSQDGVCRVGFVSLIADRKYLRDNFGGWDEVRVAADSELLHRIEAFEGNCLPQQLLPLMLCLDREGGLTRHAELGQFLEGGAAPARVAYKDEFTSAHKGFDKREFKYEIPQKGRPFRAPSNMLNNPDVVRKVYKEAESGRV